MVALFAELDTSGVWRGRGLDAAADSARTRVVCWRPDEQCATDEPGWDTHHVVAGYEIRVLFESADSARLDVLYDKRATWNVNAYARSAEPYLWSVTLKRLADG